MKIESLSRCVDIQTLIKHNTTFNESIKLCTNTKYVLVAIYWRNDTS